MERTGMERGMASKEAMEYLCPQFETFLATLIADREKIRARAWQALGLAGALVAFFANLSLGHLNEWPLWAHVFTVAQAACLLLLSARLAKATWMPKGYACAGEDPTLWMRAEVLKQDVADLMAAHASRLEERIDYNRRLIKTEREALSSFVLWSTASPAIPAALAVACWLLGE